MPEETKIIQFKPPKDFLIFFGVLFCLALTVFLGVLSWNEIKKHSYIGKSLEFPYTITISGEGKVTVIPDIATVELGAQTEKSTVTVAHKENTEKINKLIDSLKKLGIEKKDIQTVGYNVYPQYDWVEGKQILRNYVVSQNVRVKIRDLEKIGDVLALVGELNLNQVGGLSFTVDEPEVYRQQARIKALENAKEKAEALAQVAGVKLGKIISFSEESGEVPPSPYYKGYEALGLGGGGTAPAPTVEAGSQEITVNVTVSYEIK